MGEQVTKSDTRTQAQRPPPGTGKVSPASVPLLCAGSGRPVRPGGSGQDPPAGIDKRPVLRLSLWLCPSAFRALHHPLLLHQGAQQLDFSSSQPAETCCPMAEAYLMSFYLVTHLLVGQETIC